MKKMIIRSLLVGFVLLVLSLLIKTGNPKLEPMPYVDNNNNIEEGILINPAPQTNYYSTPPLAGRGFPFSIVSLTSNYDSTNKYYKALILRNTLTDYLIYSAICFGVLYSKSKLKHEKA